MSDLPLVRVERVSKKFCRSLRRSLWYGLVDLGREIAGRAADNRLHLRPDEFLAVNDVSFELRRGECLGIIGANGAGKSTILKMLNGLIRPDAGRIEIRGRVGALIELGTGFNPVLTGRENIYVNGAVLGLGRKELDAKFDKIVEFAELGDFIDAPVQSYSSGMRVRLGFAVAAHLQPDIMLIDEVLAVGDVNFRAKCYNMISNLAQRCALIFVSHNMAQVSRLCSRALFLNHGTVVCSTADVSNAIQQYLACVDLEQPKIITGKGCHLHSVVINGKENSGVHQAEYASALRISIDATIARAVGKLIECNVSVLNRGIEVIAQCNSVINGTNMTWNAPRMTLTLKVPALLLNPDFYYMSFSILDRETREIYLWCHSVIRLAITGPIHGGAPVQLVGEWRLALF